MKLKDRKISKDLMLVLGFSEAIDQLSMASSVLRLCGVMLQGGGWSCLEKGI